MFIKEKLSSQVEPSRRATRPEPPCHPTRAAVPPDPSRRATRPEPRTTRLLYSGIIEAYLEYNIWPYLRRTICK